MQEDSHGKGGRGKVGWRGKRVEVRREQRREGRDRRKCIYLTIRP